MVNMQAVEIEPRVRTLERALFSPATASVDPGEVMRTFVADAAVPGDTYSHRYQLSGDP